MPVDHPYCPAVSTLVELLRWRAQNEPDRVGYTHLVDGDADAVDLTYAELDRGARAVAAWLQRRGSPGDRVLMMYEEGHDYLIALFGCMYAGRLAVPVHPPDPRRLARTLPRLQNIAADAGVTEILTTRDVASAARDAFESVPALATARWLAHEDLDRAAAAAWVDPHAAPTDLAYLQYTSGSTALPKGVMITHHNLLHQLADFDLGYGHTPESVLVTWLPATHDLGLVYGRFMPLFIGFRCVFFSPVAFMQRPARWLRAISRYRGTHSPSPNFGFEVAARKARPEELADVDLSSLVVALNGAEPIREESELLFIETFRPRGLRPSAVTHAMGMSEATAKILTEPIDRAPPRFIHIDASAYERNEVVVVPRGTAGARVIASCGATSGDTVVVIADPQTREPLGEGRVGEMWVGGQTVAMGYFQNEAATEATFRAYTTDGRGPFLRTGDLAFRVGGEVYLSGRLKDVLIIRGQNHHPQDLEWTVGLAHAALRPNCAIAFSVPSARGEQLVVVSEVYVDKLGDPEGVLGAIREAVGEHGLAAVGIGLLPPGALPKTSSGKLQRSMARQLWMSGELTAVVRWEAPRTTVDERPASGDGSREPAPAASAPEADSLLARLAAASGRRKERLLVEHASRVVGGLLGLDPGDVDSDRPLRELGVDSVSAVETVERLGRDLGLTVPGTALFDYPTLDDLARYLLGELARSTATAPRPSAAPAVDVAALTEDEAAAALAKELEGL